MKIRDLILIIFIGLWLTIGLNLASQESPTFDEPIHLMAGKLYTQGNFNFDPIDPPLVRIATYTLGSSLEHLTGPSLTLLPYRLVIVTITGLLFCYLLWPILNTSLLTGTLTALLILTNANLVAHSHYFTTDAISAIAAFIAALLILKESWKTRKQFLLLIFFVSLAMAAKVASLALIVPLLLIKLPQIGVKKLLILISSVFILLWSTYGFRWLPVFNHVNINFPFGGYLRAIKENILFAKRGQPLFFYGQVSNFSPLIKTPLTILFKTSLPLLVLAIWGAVSKKTRNYLWIFVLVGGVSMIKPLNFGIRHLLPLQLALIFMAVQVKPKTALSKTILIFLLVWQVIGFVHSWPQPITYTNELAGASPYRIFTDSDYDWGQGLVNLNNEIRKKGIKEFQLAYFGNVDPVRYLPPFTRIKDANPVGTLLTQPINYRQTIIISVTCYYQCGYYLDPKLGHPTPIAKSFLIFNAL